MILIKAWAFIRAFTVKLPFAGVYIGVFNSENYCGGGHKFVFFVFGKCPFLLRWKNILFGSHALHLHFIRKKSVTRTVISVNQPFIIRYTSA